MPNEPQNEPPTEHARRLVIADDSPEMRWLVRAAVGDQFTEVVEASDGRQLLWTLLRLYMTDRDHGADLVVITDLCMPAYDGLAVLDAWAELACAVPLILITGFPSALVRARAHELGARLLPKPFSTATLRHLIGEVIDRPGAKTPPPAA